VQIQDYHGDINPNNHSATDIYTNINQAYFYEQMKATVAIAGHLSEPIALEHKIRLPLLLLLR